MKYWEIVMNWSQDGEVAQNVLHYVDSNPTSIDWQEVVDAIAGNFVTTFTDILAPSCIWNSITVREDIPGSVGQTYIPTAGPIAGTSVNDQYSHVLSLLVYKRATGNVKPVRGYAYQPGVSSELLDDTGRWTTGAKAQADSFWEDMIEHVTINSGTFTMQIKAGNPTAPNTNAYNPVSFMQTAGIPSTQKRRRIGRG